MKKDYNITTLGRPAKPRSKKLVGLYNVKNVSSDINSLDNNGVAALLKLNSMFSFVDDAGNEVNSADDAVAIRVNNELSFYSLKEIFAYGKGNGGGSSEGGSTQGSNVSYTATQTSGVKLGTLKIDGVDYQIFSPEVKSPTWDNIADKPAWISDTKPSYNFSEIGSKPTTVSGYGITDAITTANIATQSVAKADIASHLYGVDYANYSPAVGDGVVAWYTIATSGSYTRSTSGMFMVSSRYSSIIFTCSMYGYGENTAIINILSYKGTSNTSYSSAKGSIRVIYSDTSYHIQVKMHIGTSTTNSNRYISTRMIGTSDGWTLATELIDGTEQVGTIVGTATASSGYAVFNSNMVISGNVGIGTDSPTKKLEVIGTAKVDTLKIGGATITWDATNKCIVVDNGIVSNSFISAYGVSSNEGGSATSLAALNDTLISSPSNGQVLQWNGTKWVNATVNTGGGGITNSLYFGDKHYNGSADATITAADLGAYTSSTLTKDVVKSKLGIADWALASSKPTYNLDDVADGTTRKLSDYLPLSGGTISGDLIVTGNKYVSYKIYKSSGVTETNPYYGKLCTITVLSAYVNAPITISLKQRGRYKDTTITIYLAGVDSRITTVSYLYVNTGLSAYVKNEGTTLVGKNECSVIGIYFKYTSQEQARAWISDCTYIDGYVSVEYSNDYLTEEPTDGWDKESDYTPVYGNATSATKLETARTLWGQSFDGSANVNGELTFGVRKMALATSYTDVWSDGINSHTWYGYDHRYPNTGVYSTTISDYFGMSFRTNKGIISFTTDGKLGIGTDSPSQRLDVNGTAKVTSLKIGDATISWDATNKCIKVDKGFASDDFISAFGVSASSSATGSVASIKLGNTSYTPDANGIINLPAYPTSVTWSSLSDKPSWIGSEKPTYAYNDLTTKPTAAQIQALVGNYVTTFGGQTGAITLKGDNTANGTINLSMSSKVLSASIIGLGAMAYKASLAASDIPSLDWSKITSGKPTTVSGYGITDAITSSNISNQSVSSASTLTTARTLSISSTAGTTGTGFDGSKNVSLVIPESLSGFESITSARLNGNLYSKSTVNSSSTSNRWILIATVNVPSQNSYVSAMIAIVSTLGHSATNRYSGIVTVRVQQQNAVGSACNRNIRIVCGNIPVEHTAITEENDGNGSTVKLYLKAPTTYTRYAVTNINYAEYSGATIDFTQVIYGTTEPSTERFSLENIASSAASATTADEASKLSTLRTLWGQSFDGTGNVSGALTDTGSITPSGNNNSDIGSNDLGYRYGYFKLICSQSGLPLDFAANDGISDIHIDTSGNVGIGTTSPLSKLDVNGTISLGYSSANAANASLDMRRNSYNYVWATTTGGAILMGTNNSTKNTSNASIAILANGRVGIGKGMAVGNITQALYVYGNILASGETTAYSDIRKKKLVEYKTFSAEEIANAPLFTFHWNDREDNTEHLGTSAQYWQKVTPWLVQGEDILSLNYSALGVAMGISLAKNVVDHEARIKALEKENEELKRKLKVIA